MMRKKIFHSINLMALTIFNGCTIYKGAELATDSIIDFEQELKSSSMVVSSEASWQKSGGFESEAALFISVRENDQCSGNYFFKDMVLDSRTLPTRHFRVTYWMKVSEIRGAGGAGILLDCLDKNGKKIAVMGRSQLYKKIGKMNKWQKIDHLKDSRWQSYSMEMDIPAATESMRIKAGLFDCCGTVTIDRIIIRNTPSVKELLQQADPITVEISNKAIKPLLNPLLFSVNAEYFFEGTYVGTLPEKDKKNKREEYAKLLKQAGVRFLRFPGGMPAHYYFAEGKKYQRKLVTELLPKYKRYSRYPRSFYIEFADIMEFCRDFNIEMLYQTNTHFYVNSKGRIRAITNNKLAQKCPGLYDRDRVNEAAEALGRIIDSIPAGCKIKYWEIGNEEFARMSVDEYAAIVTAFTRVIKAKVPDAVIIATGNVWTVELCKKLKKSGVIDDIQYLALHYPWGDHWLPEKGKKEANKDLNRFVMGELSWEINLNAHRKMLDKAGFKDIKLAGTETNVFKFHKWHPHSVINTPAQALLLAHNWIEAMKIKDLDVLTYHEIASTYFGMIYYNSYYNPARKMFSFIPKSMKQCPPGVPKKYFYKDKYVLLPSAKVFGMLSKHAGLPLLKTNILAPVKALQRNCDIIVSDAKGKLLVTMVNRAGKSREVGLDFKDLKVSGKATFSGLYWKSLGLKPGNDQKISGTLIIAADKLKLKLKPFSVTQLEVPVK
jgi:hypothetical protein